MTDYTDSELPEKDKEKENKDEQETRADMPFLDHVEELRWRIIKSILAVAVMGIIAFAFAGHIYKFATIPLGDVKLHFTEVTGSGNSSLPDCIRPKNSMFCRWWLPRLSFF